MTGPGKTSPDNTQRHGQNTKLYQHPRKDNRNRTDMPVGKQARIGRDGNHAPIHRTDNQIPAQHTYGNKIHEINAGQFTPQDQPEEDGEEGYADNWIKQDKKPTQTEISEPGQQFSQHQGLESGTKRSMAYKAKTIGLSNI